MAQVFDIVAVLMDGSAPSGNDSQLTQSPFPLLLAQGIDAILRFAIRRQSQLPLNLSGCTVTFGWAKMPVDSASGQDQPLQRNAVNQSPLADGIAHGLIVPADTLPMKVVDAWGWGAWVTLADNTRQPIVPLSTLAIEGSAVIPGAPVTVPVLPTQANEQSGIETFAAQTEKTVTLSAAYANTSYKIGLTPNDIVAVYYEKLSASQFKIKASGPFTGEVSWHTEP